MTNKQFKTIRANMGLTQKEFAEMLGYETPVSVMRKESGHTPITRQDEIIINFLLINNLKPAKKL